MSVISKTPGIEAGLKQLEMYANASAVIEAKDLAFEARAQRDSAVLIGSVALKEHIGVEPVVIPENNTEAVVASLDHGLELAAEGDPVARKMVYTNVLTDWIERTYKSGSVVTVGIERSDKGHKQYGQYMSQVHTNSLQVMGDPVMKQRAKSETRNAMRQQHADSEGLFSDYNMVTLSLASDQYRSYQELKGAGFFAETMSAAFQVVGEDTEGDLQIESAFVSGAEEGAVSPQGMDKSKIFDVAAVVEMARLLGVDYSGLGTEEILARPLMIPKEMMPNGAVDLVRLYDDAVERVTGRQSFFGNPHSGAKDYIGHLELCAQRDAAAEGSVQAVVNQLVSESTTLNTAQAATNRLHELNDARLKERIVVDSSIDANVLGYHVASKIREARAHYAIGDIERAMEVQKDIADRGQSDSCPSGIKSESTVVGGPGGAESESSLEGTGSDSDQYGSLRFKCPKGCVNERPKGKLISHCTQCDTDVSCGNKDAVDIRPVAGPRLEEVTVPRSMLKQMFDEINARLREESIAQEDLELAA